MINVDNLTSQYVFFLGNVFFHYLEWCNSQGVRNVAIYTCMHACTTKHINENVSEKKNEFAKIKCLHG